VSRQSRAFAHGSAHILIFTPEGKTILIDGGKESEGDTVLAYLAVYGNDTIDLIAATHSDSNNIGRLIIVTSFMKYGSEK
jgi:competence protein ComEC